MVSIDALTMMYFLHLRSLHTTCVATRSHLGRQRHVGRYFRLTLLLTICKLPASLFTHRYYCIMCKYNTHYTGYMVS